jgi:hypothetical protein
VMIAPEGLLKRGSVNLMRDLDFRSSGLKYHKFRVHPWLKVLYADAPESLLFLPMVYSCTSWLLCDPRLKRTGGEEAISLVRKCWTNHPLSNGAIDLLIHIKDLSQNTPALWLMCEELLSASERLAQCLHNVDLPRYTGDTSTACACYRFSEAASTNFRKQLTPLEERALLGSVGPLKSQSVKVIKRDLELPQLQHQSFDVEKEEQELLNLANKKMQEQSNLAFCLDRSEAHFNSIVGQEILLEEAKSWETDSKSTLFTLSVSTASVRSKLVDVQSRANVEFKRLSNILFTDFIMDTSCYTHQSQLKLCFRAGRAVNEYPVLHLSTRIA